jgi:hypothetical protein
MNPDGTDLPFSLSSQLDSLTIKRLPGEISENQEQKASDTYRKIRDVVNLSKSISIGVQNTYYGAQNEPITPVGQSIASMIEEIQLIMY